MPSPRVPITQNTAMFFVTTTVRNWHGVLQQHNHFEILLGSLICCQKYKDLKIFAWVFMDNHLHLIIKSQDVGGFLRDFKKHTAYEIIKSLRKMHPETAELFELPTEKYCFWEKTNMPKVIETEESYYQKKQYIDYNLVRKN
jgi:REP element-mobilizing transposase RayT